MVGSTFLKPIVDVPYRLLHAADRYHFLHYYNLLPKFIARQNITLLLQMPHWCPIQSSDYHTIQIIIVQDGERAKTSLSAIEVEQRVR
jgi:hypothetical protein